MDRRTEQAHNEPGWHLRTEAEAMADNSPTMRRRQLGAELARLREGAGKKQTDAAEWVGIPSTSISRIERGQRKVNLGHLRLMLQLYDVGSPHAEALVQLARQSDERGWWADYGTTVPPWFADFLGMETAAQRLRTYESTFIPGLLQTGRYLEALASSSDVDEDRHAELRATRQRRLTDDNPLILDAVLDEGAVRRQVGGPDVMREQLAHLRSIMDLPNVTLRVLPFSAGAHPGTTSFVVMGFEEAPMDTVYVELRGGALYMEKPADVERYSASFDQITALALDEAETSSLLADLTRGGNVL